MTEKQQLLAPSGARKLVASPFEENRVRSFAKTHLLARCRSYARTVRAAVATPVGSATFVVATLVYMGLFLWLSGMLIIQSQLNYYDIPMFNYDLNPGVMQPYLIFVPNPDVLLFVNLTAAVVTLVLGGLVGFSAALLVYSWRRVRVARKGGSSLILGVLPTLVQYVGLGCCGTPAFPVLLGLLPSSAATFGVRLGIHYNLMLGAIVALMGGGIIFTLERIRRADLCAVFLARSQSSYAK